MNKILYLLILTALFISCSDDNDNNEPVNGNNTIDEKIIGKWKVDYSKTIKPAVYDEPTGKVNYPDDASIIEYEGDFGELNIIPKSGLFDANEYNIEIKSDNSITITRANNNPTTVISYIIEDGYLKWQTSTTNPKGVNKYRIENGKLIMELIKAEGATINRYVISEYSRIK